MENDPFAILLPDTLLHPSLKQNMLSSPSYFFLLAGQNEKTYVFALSNWLREMVSVLIQDVEFRFGFSQFSYFHFVLHCCLGLCVKPILFSYTATAPLA